MTSDKRRTYPAVNLAERHPETRHGRAVSEIRIYRPLYLLGRPIQTRNCLQFARDDLIRIHESFREERLPANSVHT